LSFEEKQAIWNYCVRDWDNGQPVSAYVPFEKAIPIHQSLARWRIIAAGNRFAKSLIAAMECVAYMCQPGTHIWIAGPEYVVCDNEWEYLEQCLTNSPLWTDYLRPKIQAKLDTAGSKKSADRCLHVRRNHPKSIEIWYPGESPAIIEQVSYNKKQSWAALEGKKLSGLVFAEGSKVPGDVFERHFKNRLSDKYGWIIFPSTPKGRDEILWPAFQKGQSQKWDIAIDRKNRVVTPTKIDIQPSIYHVSRASHYMDSYETFIHAGYENPFYNQSNYDADVRNLFAGKLDEHTFRERNFGTFESFSGSYFTGVDWSRVLKNSKDVPIPEDAAHYRTIDPGRATKACCLWVAICKPDAFGIEQWIFYDELYESGLWAQALAKKIKDQTRYPIVLSVVDRVASRHTDHSERSVEIQLRDEGIDPIAVPVVMPHKSVDRLNKLKPWFVHAQITILEDRCPNLVRELQELEYEPARYANGHTVRDEILGKSDTHAIDATTYLFWVGPKWREQESVVPEPENKKPVVQPGSFLWYERQDMNRSAVELIGSY
jgi:hypothetical protein